MRIYKRTRRDDGQVKQARRWHVEWFDQRNQLKRRTPGYTDKSATEELGRKLERLSAIAAQQDEPDGDLRRWIETLPAKMMQTLVGYGLIDQRRAAASKTLAEHVEDYHQRQLSAGVTKKTADHSRMRVLAICSAAKAKYWSDLTASKVQNAIAGIRTHGKPLKIGTRNNYLTAMNAFINWMIEDARASQSPLVGLRRQIVTDKTERRALSMNELRRLLTAALTGPDFQWGRRGMTKGSISGADRVTIYLLAMETGLRSDELRTLTCASFNLDTLPYSLTVKAAYSKSSRQDVVLLRPDSDMIPMLRQLLANKLPGARALSMPPATRMATMIRMDLEAAGIDVVDDQDRVVDFHALRHTFITNVVQGGATVKTTQSLARHANPTLTFKVYAHEDDESKLAALDALPKVSPVDDEAAVKTGTDDTEVNAHPKKVDPKFDRVFDRNSAGSSGSPRVAIGDSGPETAIQGRQEGSNCTASVRAIRSCEGDSQERYGALSGLWYRWWPTNPGRWPGFTGKQPIEP